MAKGPTVPRDERDDLPPAERRRQEDLLDEALQETFPASDPISPARPGEPGEAEAPAE